MRKILYLLPVAAFFVSCVADSIQEELSTSQGQHGVCLFDASISEREGTRVVGEWGTDGILAEWESSDRIGVFAGDETQAAVFTVKELDGTNAVFEGETIADAASYLAFYPYSELLGREGTSLSGKMNFLQRYSSPGYGENRIGIQPDFFPMLAYSPTGAHSLSFRQMCAYIRVRVRASATLAGDTYLKSVILQGNDGEVLAGEGIRVAVAAADDASLNIRTGDPVLSVDASEQTYSAVALDLTDPDQPEGETNGSLLSQSEFTEFYIALPPQNFAKGCKLTFIDTRNRYMGTLTSKPFNAARAQFVTFRAGGGEKVFEYIADNALIWQDHAEAAPACEPASGIPERVRSDGRQRRQSRQLLCDHSVDAGGASRRSFLLSGQIARPVGNGLLGRPAARHERLHGFHRRQDDGPDGR